MHGTSDDEISDQFIHGLELIIGCEVHLKRIHKPLNKLVYFPNEFYKLQTWLVEVAHIVNRMNLQIMLQ